MSKVLVDQEWLKRLHRDLDACQKVIWLGLRGADPAYCQDAQDRLKEIDELLAQPAGADAVEVLARGYFHALPEENDYDFRDAADISGDCAGCVPAVIVSYAALSAVTAERDRLLASKLYWVAPAGSGLARCVTDERYRKFSPSIRAKYDPVCCVDAAMDAKEE